MGAFRLYLAVLVVVQHLGGGERTSASIGGQAGLVAVFSFYVLSGYLIARVVKTTYSGGGKGLLSFAANRFLRIYPTYWFVAAFSLGVVLWLPGFAVQLNGALKLPTSVTDATAQISIFGLHKIFYLNQSRLIPTGWSLNVELIYYAVNAAILGRSRHLAWLWWTGSAALAAFYAAESSSHAVYYTIWGPSICFSSGAVLAHYRLSWEMVDKSWVHRLLPFFGIALLAFAPDLKLPLSELAVLYCTIPVTVYAIVALEPAWTNGRLRRADKVMADLSYPVFLCHWPLAVLVSHYLLSDANSGGLLFATTLPLSIAFAWLITAVLEAPVRSLRARIRETARQEERVAAALSGAPDRDSGTKLDPIRP